MAELTAFGFHPGRSLLHRLDVRFKLASLILISLSGMQAHFRGLGVLSLVLLFLGLRTRLSWKSLVLETRYFAILLGVIWLSRALVTPGAPMATVCGLSLTREGMADGALICWRLSCVVVAGLLFVHTTRSSQVRSAVVWALNPFPLIPAQRVGTMIALLMRFIPVILNQSRETSDALKARALESRKNPVFRLAVTAMVLLRKVFEDADRLVVAMEARCYSEHRTLPEFSASRADWVAAASAAALSLLMLWR